MAFGGILLDLQHVDMNLIPHIQNDFGLIHRLPLTIKTSFVYHLGVVEFTVLIYGTQVGTHRIRLDDYHILRHPAF